MAFSFGCRTKDQISDHISSSLSGDEETSEPIADAPDQATNEQTMQLEPKAGDTIAIMKTNHGDIHLLLYTELAPETTKNFIELANADKYDGTKFHRVINDFMIQGGDFTNHNGTGGHSYKGEGTSIEDEFAEGLSHIKGALSMANAGPNTGGSQFFIVHKEEGTDWLNGAHAIFGYAYKGTDIVDKIAEVETKGADVPVEDVVLEDVLIETHE